MNYLKITYKYGDLMKFLSVLNIKTGYQVDTMEDDLDDLKSKLYIIKK